MKVFLESSTYLLICPTVQGPVQILRPTSKETCDNKKLLGVLLSVSDLI